MAARVVRRTRARRDVIDAYLYIAEKSPTASFDAADRLLESLQHTLEVLAENPEMGRKWEIGAAGLDGIRWFPVKDFPNHLVFYAPIADGIRFTRLLHARRDIPKLLADDFGE